MQKEAGVKLTKIQAFNDMAAYHHWRINAPLVKAFVDESRRNDPVGLGPRREVEGGEDRLARKGRQDLAHLSERGFAPEGHDRAVQGQGRNASSADAGQQADRQGRPRDGRRREEQEGRHDHGQCEERDSRHGRLFLQHRDGQEVLRHRLRAGRRAGAHGRRHQHGV